MDMGYRTVATLIDLPRTSAMFSVSTSTISLVAALDIKLVARKPSLLILRAMLMAKERLAACLSRPCNGIPLNAIHSWMGRMGIGLPLNRNGLFGARLLFCVPYTPRSTNFQ